MVDGAARSEPRFPQDKTALAAAAIAALLDPLGAGAAAVAISGAGPSLAAYGPESHAAVGEAMREAWRQRGVGARAFVLDVAERGVVWG
jgi:homoserine kinase